MASPIVTVVATGLGHWVGVAYQVGAGEFDVV